MLKLLIVLHCIFAWIDNIGVAPFVESHFAAFTGETLKYCFEQISISSKKIIAVDYNVEGRRLRHCVRDAPPPKKRENVGILKKQGGGLPESHFHVLLFLTWENPQKRS